MDLSLKISGEINLIAVYAALVATALLIWDVAKWLRSGARLRGTATANMKMFGMGELDTQTHVAVDVDNVGDRPTTIRGVYILGYQNLWDKCRRRPSKTAVINSGLQASYPIPFRLDVGANFQASVQQTPELEEWSREHRLYAKVSHTSGRSLVLRIPPVERKSTDDF